MTIEDLSTFFGWCTVINIGALVLGGLFWILLKDSLDRFAAKLFGVTREEVKVTFLRVLLQYRAAIILLNLVPFIVLEIMA